MMIAKDFPSGQGYVLTQKGKNFGKTFMDEKGGKTGKSENAMWFSNEYYANLAVKLDSSWVVVSW